MGLAMIYDPIAERMSDDDIAARAKAFLDTLSPAACSDVEGKMQALKWHEDAGALKPDMYVGKRVLDWEAGLGGFSAAFYCLGAREVVAIDSWVDPSAVPEQFINTSHLSFEQISISDYATRIENRTGGFDLIFSNTVTEHINDLPSAFTIIINMMNEEGLYLNIHDNYYSPCGSHDHGFWFYGQNGYIQFQGSDCWATVERCNSSSSHRAHMTQNMPWTWNKTLDDQRNPTNCGDCPYFRRAQPWAHLKYVDDFARIFSDKSFFTQRAGSSLNKLTTFQVRQLLNEAGFHLNHFHRNECANTPSAELIVAGFSPLELKTTTSVWLCSKPREHTPT